MALSSSRPNSFRAPRLRSRLQGQLKRDWLAGPISSQGLGIEVREDVFQQGLQVPSQAARRWPKPLTSRQRSSSSATRAGSCAALGDMHQHTAAAASRPLLLICSPDEHRRRRLLECSG